ncbi:MAG: ATP synthase F0 subunit B [Acidobacteriota bacterium]|nr:ATP synthase F0 subunit B [Acidobacteriota bacterium]
MNILVKKLCLPALLLFFTMPVLAAGGEVEPIKWMKLVYKVINVIIFFGGLGWLLRKSVSEFFSNRERNIRDSLELAEKSVKDAKEKLDEIERNMANLDNQLEDIHEQAKQDLATETENMQAQAKQDAERILALAKAECENMKREALMGLKKQLADMAVKEAETIIEDSMTEDERNRLFTDFTARLGARS